jgi:polysaccharide pyruvyl transferase CsaB
MIPSESLFQYTNWGAALTKLLLSGYYGFGNLGDEAILASTIEEIGRKAPSVEVLVLSANPCETSRSHGVKAFNRMSIREVLSAMKAADLVVFGGGSLLQDSTSFRSLAYYLSIIFLAKALAKPLVVYANGIGPLHSALGKRLTRAALLTANKITLRDPESLTVLDELGVAARARVTADPAFLLTAAPTDRVRDILSAHSLDPKEKLVWLALRGGQESSFYGGLPPVIEFLRSEGFRPGLLVMQERDREISEWVNAVLQSEGGCPLPLVKDLSPREALGLLREGEFCFGMRLHTLILSAHAGVPFIGVEIDPKIGAFCRTVGNPVLPDPRRARTDLLEETKAFLANRSQYEARLKDRLPSLRALAEENVDMLLKMLTY